MRPPLPDRDPSRMEEDRRLMREVGLRPYDLVRLPPKRRAVLLALLAKAQAHRPR